MTILKLFQYVKDFQTYKPGDTIFKEGEVGELMYVVIDGEIDVTLNGKMVETVGAGSIVGEMALIDHKTRSATAVAKTDAKLVPVDQKRFTFMVQETPHFALEVMAMMAERLRHELRRDRVAE